MIKEGLTFTSTCMVDQTNTAIAAGSGNLEVFATPMMIALMENAAMNAVKDSLEVGAATVGTQINVSHMKATPVGDRVEAIATLTAVEGRKLAFSVVAKDSNGTIGEGTHERFVIDCERFMAKLR